MYEAESVDRSSASDLSVLCWNSTVIRFRSVTLASLGEKSRPMQTLVDRDFPENISILRFFDYFFISSLSNATIYFSVSGESTIRVHLAILIYLHM